MGEGRVQGLTVPLDQLVASYDHHHTDYMAEAPGLHRAMRGACPIGKATKYGGFWVLTRYQDFAEVLRNPTVFSSTEGIVIPPMRAGAVPQIPLEVDPPDVTEFRKLTASYFSPEAVEAIVPLLETTACALLESLVPRGQFDVIKDFAQPLVGMVTLKVLGLDPNAWRSYVDPLHSYIYGHGTEEERHSGLASLQARVAEDVRLLRRNPRPGVMAHLAEAAFRGRKLTDAELIGILGQFLGGGLDTAQGQIGTAIVYLGRHPDRRWRLIAEPALLPGAIEEFLRVMPAGVSSARTLLDDYELGGISMKKGDKVLLPWLAANMDPTEFVDPETVDFERATNRHMSFGFGVHKCLGIHLARAEIKVALAAILAYASDYRLIEEELERPADPGFINGYERVPILV